MNWRIYASELGKQSLAWLTYAAISESVALGTSQRLSRALYTLKSIPL
ncbi:hypothetical protein BRPE67_ECDS01720 (plasmid) [Caballeronia cordobensis]|nr:hypothetical protein BRPE67_ECDS01720 [Burkholderia sp. RPE67]